MPIAACGYTIRSYLFNAAQVDAAYAKLQKMGYDGIEGPAGEGFMTTEEQLAALKKYNLKVADVGADVTKPEEAMAKADRFGVKIIGVPSMPGDMWRSPEGFKAFAERLNKWAEPFKKGGYKLQYHSHAQEFRNFPELNGKAGVQILIEETDKEAVVFQMDTHWISAAGGDPAQWILKVKGRIPIVHYKDYAIDARCPTDPLDFVAKRYAEIGQGNINWQAVTEACRQAGVVWYCVEQDYQLINAFDSLKISVDYMRGLGIK